ncbi:MAG: GNAT family N-acetyltransferase [SAR324 cluster bacterium]|nr:GNAT family N-acetyltransferase [SAR324 cluster bacterium]MBL7035097.1 GNAT family N-acetyltransferase [SAR324 cluster bacterium]
MIIIRKALKKDAGIVFQMIRALAEYHGESADFRATLEDVERDGFGESPLYESWLAEINGTPLGLATFFLCYSTFKGKPSLLLDNLFVQESARGAKIGEKLVKQVSKRALELNCCRMELLVEKNNPARAFYEKLGFSETADRVYSIYSENFNNLAALN